MSVTRSYNYPFKRSFMNTLGTPFYAPTFLAAINWLTQIVEVGCASEE